MRTIKQDRATLQRLVESYGKADVVKFVKHINEDDEGYDEDDDYDPAREAAVDKHIKAYERNIGPIDPENMNMLRTLFYSMYSEGYFHGRKSCYDENPQYVNPEDLEEY